MAISSKYRYAVITIAACLIAGSAAAQSAPAAPPTEEKPGTPLPNPPVGEDGTVTVPSFKLRFSSFASPEAAAAYVRQLRNTAAVTSTNPAEALRLAEENFKPMMMKVQARFPYTSTKAPIAGVDAETFMPNAGIAPENKGRVLISLGGGGTAPTSALGAAPIAGMGRITVISLNPRTDKFPHASEDIAAVYRELLKDHKPKNIGIYGCSGGGQLTAQAIAWFDKEKLPMPGAIGIYCAGLYPFGQGDSEQIWVRLGHGGRSLVPREPIKDWASAPTPNRYLAGESYMNPLVRPSASKELLKHFPPTLLLSGTRSDDMSVTVQTNLDLLNAGVNSRLVLFDGLWHGFFSDVDLPESQLAYKIMVQWFMENLGKHSKG